MVQKLVLLLRTKQSFASIACQVMLQNLFCPLTQNQLCSASGSCRRDYSWSRLHGMMMPTSNAHQIIHQYLVKGQGATTLSCVSVTLSVAAAAREAPDSYQKGSLTTT
jgi:hypothetical protein